MLTIIESQKDENEILNDNYQNLNLSDNNEKMEEIVKLVIEN